MEGKRVIIAGDSSIGLCLAKQLIDQGAWVVVAARDIIKLEKVMSELGAKASAYELDTSNEQAVIQFFSELGRFDHLVSSIKVAHLDASFKQTKSLATHKAFETKFWGQYYLARHSIENIALGGSIVLTSGMTSSRLYSGFSGAAAINGAIESLTKSLAVELAPIRVNAVALGFIERFDHDLERLAQVVKLGGRMLVDRLGSQDEVASAYLYLLNNAYANGTVLNVDGGGVCV